MKIAYKHLINRLQKKPSIKELSRNLLQLGHENQIDDGFIDIEFTPNRGDCLSINGLIRDLSVFYELNDNPKIFDGDFDSLSINFNNFDHDTCTSISFLKIEIDKIKKNYNGYLSNYFKEFNLSKNNLFADISNYISYETGQPTHCFDFKKLDTDIAFKNEYCDKDFKTLLGKKIKLRGKNPFFEQNDKPISLAGVMGGMKTSCSSDTKIVLIECAHFNPEEIIGKSQKYDIHSDASYKFERGTDPLCHDYVLRRFVNVVEENADIKKLEIYQKEFKPFKPKKIELKSELLNKIIGIQLNNEDYLNYFKKLGFKQNKNTLEVPSYRSDVNNHNDLAEEVARVIGYDNIKSSEIKLPKKSLKRSFKTEELLKGYLVKNGFYEIISNPFVSEYDKNSIVVLNPLDTNKKYIRNNLKRSLINKMLFNERRQKDCIKLFEISNLYYYEGSQVKEKRKLGLIASGRVGKNYKDFSKKIDEKYIKNIFQKIKIDNVNLEILPRNIFNSKSQNKVIYCEFDLDDLISSSLENLNVSSPPKKFIKYNKISEFPSSIRDLSFLVTNNDSLIKLQNIMLNYSNKMIKEIFIFDFYQNPESNELKIGFRLIFQSNYKTVKDEEVNNILNDIIKKSISISGIEIPGLTK
tara:strand:+ start:6852 stop:8762 length:1911 start_codon:yes stop_codon:yes gene_type:complete